MADRDDTKRPVMWLLVGVNGAGKTTFYEQRLASTSLPFVNADVIARETWGAKAEAARAYDAMRLAEARRAELIAARQSFIAETVFSHPSKLTLLQEARAAGYLTYVVFINVRSTNLAVSRVRQRHARGGHDVPEEKVRERHSRTLENVRAALPLADRLLVFDNSRLGKPYEYVMTFARGRVSKVSQSVPQWARELFSPELSRYSLSRLNPAARSFEEARALARKVLGAGVSVSVARTRATAYTGRIIGESDQHVLQRVGETSVVAHFRERLSAAPNIDDFATIRYADGAGRVTVRATRLAKKEQDRER